MRKVPITIVKELDKAVNTYDLIFDDFLKKRQGKPYIYWMLHYFSLEEFQDKLSTNLSILSYRDTLHIIHIASKLNKLNYLPDAMFSFEELAEESPETLFPLLYPKPILPDDLYFENLLTENPVIHLVAQKGLLHHLFEHYYRGKERQFVDDILYAINNQDQTPLDVVIEKKHLQTLSNDILVAMQAYEPTLAPKPYSSSLNKNEVIAPFLVKALKSNLFDSIPSFWFTKEILERYFSDSEGIPNAAGDYIIHYIARKGLFHKLPKAAKNLRALFIESEPSTGNNKPLMAIDLLIKNEEMNQFTKEQLAQLDKLAQNYHSVNYLIWRKRQTEITTNESPELVSQIRLT